MSHGWLIPPIALFLIWKARRAQGAGQTEIASHEANTTGDYRPLFLGGFMALLTVHIFAGLADVSSIAGLALVGLIVSFAGLLEGWRGLRPILFPLGFLVFMVPPPEFIISGINFKLKLFAADIACHWLNLTGMGAIREGSFMLFSDQKLAIGDVCSGLRSLLALMALGCLFAYGVRDKGWKHVTAILSATVPAAVIGNGLRIGMVCYLVEWFGSEAVFKPLIGTTDLHLLTGGLIFAAALGFLLAVNALCDRLFSTRRSGEAR